MATRNRLRQLRTAQGLSKQELANRIPSRYGNHETVSWRTIDRWEAGAPILEAHWARLSEIFGVSVGHVLGLDDPNNNDHRSAA